MKQIPYASTIGSLMYAMLCTRPDIDLAVSVTSRYQSNPGEEHWISVKCILKYMRSVEKIQCRGKMVILKLFQNYDFTVKKY